jgi:quercetin dioxygenase-like cupin family protein
MIRVGDAIDNPVTGETMTFLLTGRETNGELLRIAMRVRPDGFVASEHLHPRQEERFWVADGEITLRIDGEERRYMAGEAITIPAGTPHVWWNSGPSELRVLVEFRPAGRFAEFITTFFAFARAGRTNRRGIPTSPFQLAATFAEYADVIRGTRPPWVIQRLLFAVLNPIGRVLGYRPDVAYGAGNRIDLEHPHRNRTCHPDPESSYQVDPSPYNRKLVQRRTLHAISYGSVDASREVQSGCA